ncbi:MAG TPA: hypothetical protein VD886_01695 [Herpetosiphonaceae bacterium]|nr:hypothetical protein [Herpetosiphonaceae bacterium]
MLDSSSLTYSWLTDQELDQIWELAQRPFTIGQWGPLWHAWNWPYAAEANDQYGFDFSVDDRFAVTGRREGGLFPLCLIRFGFWEGYNPDGHPDPTTYAEEHCAYDALFWQHKERVQRRYGTPQFDLIDTTDGRIPLHAAIWQTPHGLCILQQSAIDPQYGYEVHFWLEALPDATFTPSESLTTWLEERHRPPAEDIP